jgi:hypothetical protein
MIYPQPTGTRPSDSALKNHEDFCIAMKRTTLQARIKNLALLVRLKSTIRHVSIKRHVFVVTITPVPIQKSETPLI